jgi:hypothetical protein
MKNLVVLAGLIAAASTGCIISSDSGSGEPHVGATWQIKSIASNSEIGCPPGFDTAALYNQPIDANGNSVGSPIIDLFDCVAGAGRSAPLPATTYSTWVEITNTNNTSVYARSVPATLDITDVDMTYNTDIYDDGGFFAMSWQLIGASSNQPIDCATAGAAGTDGGVEAISTDISNSQNSADDQFTCSDGYGVSAALSAGAYTVVVHPFNNSGALGQSVTLTNKVIQSRDQSPDEVTNLGMLTLPVDGH